MNEIVYEKYLRAWRVCLQIKEILRSAEQDEFNSTLWKFDLLLFKAKQQQKQRGENGASS